MQEKNEILCLTRDLRVCCAHAQETRKSTEICQKSIETRQKSTKTSKNKGKISINEEKSGNNFFMKKFLENTEKQIVVVCFGTPLVTGDALGPKVGSLLQTWNVPCFVYGTEARPVTATNMIEYMAHIQRVHGEATILSVDASLGKKEKIGQITVRKDGVCPAGVKGEKRRFGDVGLLGVVGENNAEPMKELLTISEDYIVKMAYKVAVVIKQAICEAVV